MHPETLWQVKYLEWRATMVVDEFQHGGTVSSKNIQELAKAAANIRVIVDRYKKHGRRKGSGDEYKFPNPRD